MDNKILNAALEYADKGWAVFPISRDKTPLVPHGCKDATTDKEQIKEWWDKKPFANVAVATGSKSGGLVVVDLDIDEEKGKHGDEAFDDWCDENSVFIESRTVVTGRGGKHLYFTSSEPFGNLVGCLDGVDIRGEGGYVVAPPSIHGKTGNEYYWDDVSEEDDIVCVQDDSDVEFFLHEMFKGKKQSGEYEKTDFSQPVEEGGRNDRVFKYAASLQGQGFTDQQITEFVEVYNEKNVVPPLDDKELHRTIQSVLDHAEWKGTDSKKTEKKSGQRKKENIKNLQPLRRATDLMEENLPVLRKIVGVGEDVPFLVEGTCILSAKSKLGKSWLALEMCDAISRGADFLGYKTEKCSTLYLDLETQKNLKQTRLKKLEKITGCKISQNFYIQDTALFLEEGFEEEIENYMSEDPNIGVIVVDVFQMILKGKPTSNNEYDFYYKKIGILNEISKKYHISIILVCHDRKISDSDPFSNILGSTALQGATSQMIVMYKSKFNSPVAHIAAKGRTIDGLPEMDIYMDKGYWKKADNASYMQKQDEYRSSKIYKGLLELINGSKMWEGRCSSFFNDCADVGIDLDLPTDKSGKTDFRSIAVTFGDSAFQELLKENNIETKIIKNGQGARSYRFTVDTVDWQSDAVDENPFKLP